MQIRSLLWRGFPIWPPEWQVTYCGAGEEGILEKVRLRQDQKPGFISVSVNHLGKSRLGVIIIDDPDQLEILYHKLQENIGSPLIEVGKSQIDLSPSTPKYGMKQVRPKSPAVDRKRVVHQE